MELKRVYIRNYRSIEEASIELSTVTAFVGPNNAGKSNVIDAIRALFEGPGVAEEQDFCAFARRRRQIVLEGEVHFSSSERAVLTKRLHRKSPAVATFRVVYNRSTGERVEAIQSSVRLGKRGSQIIRDQIKSWCSILTIPAVRTASQDISLDEETILRTVLERVIREQTPGRRNRLQMAVAQLEMELQSELTHLGEQLRSELGDTFRISAVNLVPERSSLVASLAALRLEILDPLPTPIGEKGSGLQSAAVVALHRIAGREIGASSRLQLILFEEPESLLHPSAQRSVLASLSSEHTQVVVSTHSPVVLDALPKENPERVIRITRDTQGRTSTARQRWSDAARELITRNVGLRLSEIFFADGAVLVEGPSDRDVVETLGRRLHQWDAKGIVVVETGGKDRLGDGIALCSQLGVPAVAICDKDAVNNEQSLVGRLRTVAGLSSTETSAITSRALKMMTPDSACDLTNELNGVLHAHGCHSLPVDLEYALVDERNAEAVFNALCARDVFGIGREWRRRFREARRNGGERSSADELRAWFGAKDVTLGRREGPGSRAYVPGNLVRHLSPGQVTSCLRAALRFADERLALI